MKQKRPKDKVQISNKILMDIFNQWFKDSPENLIILIRDDFYYSKYHGKFPVYKRMLRKLGPTILANLHNENFGKEANFLWKFYKKQFPRSRIIHSELFK